MAFLQRQINRGSISTGNYEIDNSVKLEADNTEYLNRVIASGGNRKTWTISAWVKRTEISDATHGGGHTIFGVNVSGNEGTIVRFNTGTTAATIDTIQIDIGAGGTLSRSHTWQKFRDTSAWYHIVLAVDTTQSTATDRFKLYVNGELVTSYYSRNNPAQNFDTSNNQADNSCTQHIGAYTVSGTAYGKFCGYIAEVNHVDGAALAPTAFGKFDDDSGIWIPLKASPTYGTNGFFLDFADSGNLGDDESGNGLDFTETNIAAADQAVDTPTNNFATVSTAMFVSHDLGYSTTSDGGTLFRVTEFDTWVTAVSSIGVTKGKWYAEFKVIGARNNTMWGIASMEQLEGNSGYATGNGSHIGQANKNWGIGYYQANGKLYVVNNAGSSTTASWGSAVSQNAVVSVALDMDNYKLYMALNNTYQNSGDPTSGATGTGAISIDATETVAIATSGYSLGSGNDTIAGVNFGGYVTGGMYSQATDGNGYGAFRYAPPSGYYALCGKNLAEYG